MKKILMTASAVSLAAGAAAAGGIDRSGQGLGQLFEKGRYFELSFGSVSPDVSGNDVAVFGGKASGDVAASYVPYSFAYKQDFGDKMSFALILDQPFGADVQYPTAASGGSVALGGTIAQTTATALTGLGRYRFDNGFSVHAGLRAEHASGNITLSGAAYGALSGYNVTLNDDIGIGYVAGVAYERPDIALRVALTYNSKITLKMDTVEAIGASTVATSVTSISTPQSVNLDVQSGIAKDTLLFGQIRWVDWSGFQISPQFFKGATGGAGLVDLDDTTTYTVGVGRKFNDTWSGAASVSYEKELDPLVSPLAPTNGKLGVTLAAIYTKDNMKITTGINYTKLGDAQPETGTPDVARANFSGNTALGIGVKVGFTF
jgi:long-chain fatty acid transport protein